MKIHTSPDDDGLSNEDIPRKKPSRPTAPKPQVVEDSSISRVVEIL
jgi:hypothetical protein